MKKFKVEITEYLQVQIIIEAKDKNEALKKVKDLYNNNEIVLDYEDHTGTTIKIIK